MLRLVDRGIPLPFGAVRNRRSMISVENFVDVLVRSEHEQGAAGATLLVSDGHDLSTADLVRAIAGAMNRRPRLIPVPVPMLRALGRLAGVGGEIDRLTDSLSIDISETRARLGWTPPLTVDQGIRNTVVAYRNATRTRHSLATAEQR
jgi:nucleoside-diphosphate-sugar epimerase